MPDITKGKLFTSGETVTASEMNSLVDDAVINTSAITESKIAAGAVTNAKIASSAGIGLSKLASGTDGQILICSATGIPTYQTLSGVTINAGAVSLDANSVDSDQYVDGSIDTAHLADDAVTTAKIAALDPSPAGSFTSSSVTINSAGQVTAASSGSSPSVTTITIAGDWTKPTGATLIQVTVIGAGGGGGDVGSFSGGEAGDGGVVSDWIDVTAVTTVAVTIGTGGTGATGGENNGTDGTSSTFGSYLTGGGGPGGLQGAATKGSNGGVAGIQKTAIEETFMKVGPAYDGKGGLKGIDGSSGAVVVRVMG